MNKQIKTEQEKVRIIVDFRTVWAFMWRWLAIILAMYIPTIIFIAIAL